MAFGVKIINDGGAVQIDSTYSNLMLVDEGTITTSVRYGSNAGACYADALQKSNLVSPVVALRCDELCTILYSENDGNGNYTFHIATQDTGKTVHWFLFDSPNNKPDPAGEYGMVVADDDGNKVYDSRRRALRIIGFLNNPTQNHVVNYGVGKIAVVPSQINKNTFTQFIGSPNPDTYIFTMCGAVKTPSYNSLSIADIVTSVFYYDGVPSILFPQNNNPNNNWMVVDVTNF